MFLGIKNEARVWVRPDSNPASSLGIDQDRGPTLHESIARQDHLLMIAETRPIESRGSKQAVACVVSIVHNTRLTSLHRITRSGER